MTHTAEAWPTQADSLKHIGELVTVLCAKTGEVILTGKVRGYSDLLKSGGILVPHPTKGYDHVVAALRFPPSPEEYEREMASYRFRKVR